MWDHGRWGLRRGGWSGVRCPTRDLLDLFVLSSHRAFEVVDDRFQGSQRAVDELKLPIRLLSDPTVFLDEVADDFDVVHGDV